MYTSDYIAKVWRCLTLLVLCASEPRMLRWLRF